MNCRKYNYIQAFMSVTDTTLHSFVLFKNSIKKVMIPIPQYPLYSALIAKLTGTQVDYHLDEDNNWAASKETLSRQLNQARMNGIDVKALVIINPGNPTGQVFSRQELEVICKVRRPIGDRVVFQPCAQCLLWHSIMRSLICFLLL